jgi:hypothetical protein
VSVVVPVTVPLLTATVTGMDAVVTTFSALSLTSTTGCVLKSTPAAAVAGCAVMTSLTAAPAVTVTVMLLEVPAVVAVMAVLPLRTPTTSPVGATVATAASADVQVKGDAFTTRPLVSR